MVTRKIAPPKHLESYIRFFWTLEFTGISSQDSLFRVFARKYPRLVIQHHNGRSGIYHGKDFLPTAYLSGLNTKPYDCGIRPSITTIGVSFWPHAMKPIFGVDVSALVNELPDFSNFDSSPLIDRLFYAGTVEEKVSILCIYFTNRLRNCAAPEKMYEQGWRMLMRDNSELQVQQLTRVFNLSERQLQRRFKEHLGLSPKQYLMLNRFERSLGMLQRGHTHSLLDIAYDLGYSDQSHFIREFKQFSGHTPTQYINTDKLYDERSAFILNNTGNGQLVNSRQELGLH